MPIAQCVPVHRDAMSMAFGELEGEAAQAFMRTQERVNAEPGTYRRHFRVGKPGRE